MRVNTVVGLGNPGRKYRNTPHNVGFAAVDLLALRLGCRWRRSLRLKAQTCSGSGPGGDVLLIKPQTYMNNSGWSVAQLCRHRGIGPDELMVVLDDADLPLGRLRIRARGSNGGHKGLQSVVQHVGDSAFARIRIGVGRNNDKSDLVDHVLSPFGSAEGRGVAKVLDCAADAVLCVLEMGTEAAMNRYNGLEILKENGQSPQD